MTKLNKDLIKDYINNSSSNATDETYSCDYINDLIVSDFNSSTGIGYTKFPDGTCIIWGQDHTELAVGGGNGNVRDYTYPLTLVDNNYSCTISVWDGGNGFSFIATAVALKSTTGFRAYCWNNNSATGYISGFMWQVVGRWK